MAAKPAAAKPTKRAPRGVACDTCGKRVTSAKRLAYYRDIGVDYADCRDCVPLPGRI